MPTEEHHQEWLKPENWRGGWFSIYYAPADSRVWVPKRRPAFGWTLNFARRTSYAYLTLLLLPAVSLLIAAVYFAGNRTP